jgi:hypothetical protein
MKILLAGIAAMATLLTGCAGSSDVTAEETSIAISELAPVQIDHQPSGESVETLYCGPYAGPGTATVRVTRPFKDDNVGCLSYKDVVTKFLDSAAVITGVNEGIIDGWRCLTFGAVKTNILGYAVECHRGDESIYVDVEVVDTGEPNMP